MNFRLTLTNPVKLHIVLLYLLTDIKSKTFKFNLFMYHI